MSVGCTKGFKARQTSSAELSSNVGNNNNNQTGTAPTVAILLPAAMTASKNQIQLSGTCTDGIPVHIYGAVSAITNVNCTGGAFSAMITLATGDGEKTVEVSQTNGNLSGTNSRKFVLDTAAPAVTINSPANGATINSPVTVSGSCETGLNVTLNGAGLSSPSTVTCASGSFSSSVFLSAGSGSKAITASQTDSAQNTGNNTKNYQYTMPANAISIAITAPTAGYAAKDGVTLQGTCKTGLNVVISGGVDAQSSTACTNGMFSSAVTFSNEEGNKEIIVSQTDSTNNSSGQDRRTFLHDSVAPVLNVMSPAEGAKVKSSITVMGTCESGINVNIAGTGVTTPGVAVACMNNAFSSTITLSANDGTKMVQVWQTDAAGNTGQVVRNLTKDTVAPGLTIATPADGASVVGDSAALTGNCEVGLDINIAGAGATAGKVACSASPYSISVALSSGDGSKAIQLSQTDGAGNSTTVSRNVNRTTPVVPPPVTCNANTGLEYVKDVKPILTAKCGSCHMNGVVSGGFAIPNFADDATARAATNIWNQALSAINSGFMPLGGSMTAAEKSTINTWYTSPPSGPDPGFVPIQRLSARQWDNSVSDLLGITVTQGVATFPADPLGAGQFSNNTTQLAAIGPEYFAKLKIASETAVDNAFNNATAKQKLTSCGTTSGSTLAPFTVAATSASLKYDASGAAQAGAEEMTDNGRLTFTLAAGSFPQAATQIIVKAGSTYGSDANGWAQFTLYVDGAVVASNVDATANMYQPFTYTVNMNANQAHTVYIDYKNDSGARSLWIQGITVQGGSSGSLNLACAENLLLDFARRAFRRPVITTRDPNDPDSYIEQSAIKAMLTGYTNLEDGLKAGYKSLLLSPNFLYRVVILAKPDDDKAIEALDGFELAAQLSYFLWNSIPDETLFNAAKNGELNTEAGIKTQISRMLASAKSGELAKELADGWLSMKTIDVVSPSDTAFTPGVRSAMRLETETFLKYIIQNNRSPLEVLTANYSFVNTDLAPLYGVSALMGATLAKTNLPAGRRGVLGQSGFLTLTTKSEKTSPIIRGVFTLRNIMCEPLPPPPPGVPPLPMQPAGTSVRQLLEFHRSNGQCVSCHQNIDPIGLSFENFGPIGKTRSVYPDGQAVQTDGNLPDGTAIANSDQLIDVLVQNKKFGTCMTKKVMSFALARDVGAADICATDTVGKTQVESSKTFVDFVTGLAMSDPFRKRRGGGQ